MRLMLFGVNKSSSVVGDNTLNGGRGYLNVVDDKTNNGGKISPQMLLLIIPTKAERGGFFMEKFSLMPLMQFGFFLPPPAICQGK